MMPDSKVLNRLKSIGFKIHPSNPVLMYCCRSLSTSEAETAKIGIRPLAEAREERQL
jgi:hypothetical protein